MSIYNVINVKFNRRIIRKIIKHSSQTHHWGGKDWIKEINQKKISWYKLSTKMKSFDVSNSHRDNIDKEKLLSKLIIFGGKYN